MSTWSGRRRPRRNADQRHGPCPRGAHLDGPVELVPGHALATSEPPEVKAAKMPAIPVGGLESSVPIVEPINPTIAEEALPVVPMARPATALGPSDT